MSKGEIVCLELSWKLVELLFGKLKHFVIFLYLLGLWNDNNPFFIHTILYDLIS